MKRVRRKYGRRFTVAMWRKWWADRQPPDNVHALREGIQEFRALLTRPHDTCR